MSTLRAALLICLALVCDFIAVFGGCGGLLWLFQAEVAAQPMLLATLPAAAWLAASLSFRLTSPLLNPILNRCFLEDMGLADARRRNPARRRSQRRSVRIPAAPALPRVQ